MKRWNKERWKGFLQGLAVPVLTMALVGGAVAATGSMQTIDALVGGISIYVDGVLQEPKNVKGEAVQPIAWQGTTYLPVRAVTNMLTDKEVSWDQGTMSVYIGKQPIAPVTKLNELEMYVENGASKYAYMYTDSDAEFKKLDRTIQPFNRLQLGYSDTYFENKYTGCAVYMLHGKYSELNGCLDISYTELGSTNAIGLAFYSVDSYGEEHLIQAYTCKAGDEPVEVSVPLTGVEILKIKRIPSEDDLWPYDSSVYNSRCGAQFYNATVTAAQ